MNLQELLARVTELKAKAQEVVNSAESDLTEAQETEFNGYMSEIESTQNKIEKLEKLNEIKDYENSFDAPIPVKSQSKKINNSIKVKKKNVKGFESFGDHLKAAFDLEVKGETFARGKYGNDIHEMMNAADGMEQQTGSKGGYLVNPEFANTLWDGANMGANDLLSRTDQYVINGESITIPANAETSRATGSRYGGVQGYWINEADSITVSNPKVRQLKLEPQEAAVLVPVTEKLLRNGGGAVESYVQKAARSEINFMAGDALINGTGAGQPLGIMNSNATLTLTRAASGNDIDAADVDAMWARLHPNARQNAVWLINTDVEPSLQGLVDANGNALFRPANGLAGEQLDMLKNRPILPIEFCETSGTSGDIILADLSWYATAMNGTGIRSDVSMHFYFDKAQSTFRFMFDLDGQSYLNSAITPYKGTNTLSPFVALADA
jgi:HK97 family phage major capsid protein